MSLLELIVICYCFPSTAATPLSYHIASLQSGTQVIGTAGWTSAPNQRGTIDIIWTSLATMFLCSWSVLCLNIPSPDDSFFRIIHRRFWLTALCFLGPEFTLQIAIGQYSSARQSVQDFAAAGHKDWTMTHAFYADMGGFTLRTSDEFPLIPVDAKQLLWLIQQDIVKRPKIKRTAIKDKNKMDGLLRLITLFQVTWFAINTVGRACAGLAITCMELTAAAFIVCTLATSFFWFHKPADVASAEHLQTEYTMEAIYNKVCKFKGITSPHMYYRTPLDIISRQEWAWSKYWTNWMNILRVINIRFSPKTMPVDRFENTISLPLPLSWYFLFAFLSLGYSGLFVGGWNFVFPTIVERYLWRTASLGLFGCCISYALVTHLTLDAYPALKTRFQGRFLRKSEASNDTRPQRSWIGQRAHGVAQKIRNNSVSQDPELELPLKALLPIYVLGFIYCCSRTYIFIADIIEVRSLPASAYQTVKWSTFIPHLS